MDREPVTVPVFFDVVQTLITIALLNIRIGKCGGEQWERGGGGL
jgi:hypothetical protein